MVTMKTTTCSVDDDDDNNNCNITTRVATTTNMSMTSITIPTIRTTTKMATMMKLAAAITLTM